MRPALGPLEYTVSCNTCFHLFSQCPGHFGHIELAKPLYNPLLFQNLNSLLQITCLSCHKFRMKEENVQLFAMQLELIIRGDIVAARNLYDESRRYSFDVVRNLYDESMRESFRKSAQDFTSAQNTEARHVLHTFMHSVPIKCEHCSVNSPKITCPTFGWLKTQDDLLPSKVEDILEALWKNESRLCDILCDLQCKSSNVAGKGKGYAMFFLKVILVPPSRFRPPVKFNTQVNLTRMCALLGQEELKGKRVPRMVSGKTFPSFRPWEISSRAGGFIIDCFLTGLRPREYYFHCMADCDGLVDTAIKTSHSLQQCLIKNLECLKVCYDHTVRDADGSVIQFIYGDDGLDVHKSSFIADFKVLAANRKVVLERYGSEIEDACLSKSNGFIKKLPDMVREKVTTFKNKEKKKATTHLAKKQRRSIKQKGLMRLMELKYLSSLAEPGESVGVLAAQSIGELSTKMTLNSFHFAGQGERNVTLGIPRLEEILMNAEENIRTPIMKCPLLNEWDL